jgi:hypothetical protein
VTVRRVAPTRAELEAVLATLPPEEAEKVRRRTSPAPANPPPEAPATGRPAPRFASWHSYIERTSEAERRRWCAQKAHKANASRLMSGAPKHRVTADEVLAVLTAAQGRCAHCGSLALENRPSTPAGHPAPWAPVGRRIGSLGHRVARFHGGLNTPPNLVWSCLWCNTWPSERVSGATDRGAIL